MSADLYWGERGFTELPRKCVIEGMPETTHDPFGHRPMGGYEALCQGLLGRGLRVPGGPGACQADDGTETGTPCGHAQVWHRHRTRLHPCQVPGCSCQDFRKWHDGGTGAAQ